MTFQVDANGRSHTVEVSDRGGAFLVSIDGRQLQIDVKQTGDGMSLLVGPPDGSRRSYDVSIGPAGDGGAVVVHVDGVPVEVSVASTRPSWSARGRAAAAQEAGKGPQRVVAPMPGKIVKLLVKQGDHVEPKQGLVVVEAMKMENELRARAAGTVTEVRVVEGASVEAGAILVLIE